ncbi:ClpXP protease specificity-enhancing factor [Hydrocarboniphaga effusa]|jgi:stringent starvation protein B|uniref:ClpXP protease specificity-enhancing factor n=1 Tax=Hydrocarboniphaga effusa TaxID=243629 RepID=UPI003137DD95
MPVFRSRRPYLIRAIYDWATDNGHTPHLLVSADYPGVVVPREYVQEGRITLNVSPMAVQNLDVQSDPIWFSARFSGRSFDVQVPSGAVLAVFARENGEGIVFGEVEPPESGDGKPTDTPPPPDEPSKPPRPGRPNLRVVK